MAAPVRFCRLTWGRKFLPFQAFATGGTPFRALQTCSCACSGEKEADLQENPFFSKYKNKIDEFRKENPGEYEMFIQDKEDRQKKKLADAAANKEAIKEQMDWMGSNPRFSQNAQQETQPSPGSFSMAGAKKLDSVLRTELIQDKTAEEIGKIWTDYHAQKDAVCAVIPKDTYALLHARTNMCPTFLLPMPREQGYEFFLLQFSGHECHFTPLISFQAHKENAPSCIQMVHYPDLADNKGIVLMRAEVDTKILTTVEAKFLVDQMTMYYTARSDQRFSIVRNFTVKPTEFDHMVLIKELESIGSASEQKPDKTD
ncbi:ATP synthase mitochondrial F1 complex assembly factor 1 [Branchiostoma belcheri]|nr:ATP synthase mitochondrial F1 complex assembly factor 1 [Branchiostoma belcheri]